MLGAHVQQREVRRLLMKTDDIEAFVAVLRSGSLNAAALSLGLTQPAITRRLQSLEQDLGVELLDRHTKPLKPTRLGQEVYGHCRAILREMDALRERVAGDAPPSGLLRLGVPQTLGDALLLEAVREIRSRYPELRTQVATGWGSALVSRVEHGELDAALVMFPANKIFPEGVEAQALGSMPLQVVCARDQAPSKPQRLADLHAQGWVLNPDGCGFRASLQRTLAEQGAALRINLETYGTELQLGLVADGQGLGLVPAPLLARSAYRERLAAIPLKDFKPEIQLWLIHPRFLGPLQEVVEGFGQDASRLLATG